MLEVDVYLLAGGPRPQPIVSALGWEIPFLPLESRRSLVSCWCDVLDTAVAALPGVAIGRRVILGSESVKRFAAVDLEGVEVVQEGRAHRGTAGVVYDEIQRLGSVRDRPFLVIELSASPAISVVEMMQCATEIVSREASCVLGESHLNRYCGIALMNGAAMQGVPSVGFVDLKEQLLPAIIERGGSIDAVTVAERARRVRTREEWLATIDAWDALVRRRTRGSEKQAAESYTRANLIRPTATTDGSTIVASVVMDDAVVEPGAVVARSIVGPGMRVTAGTRVVDSVLSDTPRGRAIFNEQYAALSSGVSEE